MLAGVWGLELLPHKCYSQTIETTFKLTMVALGEQTETQSRTCLRVTVDGKKLVLCSLRPGQLEQQLLNLVFTEGENVSFSITGDSPVYLSGNYLITEGIEPNVESPWANNKQTEDMSLYEKSDGCAQRTHPISQEVLNVIAKSTTENASGAISQSFFEISEDKRISKQNDTLTSNKVKDNASLFSLPTGEDNVVAGVSHGSIKRKANLNNSFQQFKSTKLDRNLGITSHGNHKENLGDKKIVSEIDKGQRLLREAYKIKKAIKKSREAQPTDNTTARTLFDGLVIEDLNIGHGRIAKKGSEVWISYTASLSNGKTVDKSPSGKSLRIRLDPGAVIQGLEKGIIGMKVGGKRKLAIPSLLAYGERGNPPHIPPDADLVYTINLLKISS